VVDLADKNSRWDSYRSTVPTEVQLGAEGEYVHAVQHRLDVGPRILRGHVLVKGIAIMEAVCAEDCTCRKAALHIGGASAVMSFALAQMAGGEKAIGIDERTDFGRQPLASMVAK